MWTLKITSITGRTNDGEIKVVQRRGYWRDDAIIAAARKAGLRGYGTLSRTGIDMNGYDPHDQDMGEVYERAEKRVFIAPRSFAETRQMYEGWAARCAFHVNQPRPLGARDVAKKRLAARKWARSRQSA